MCEVLDLSIGYNKGLKTLCPKKVILSIKIFRCSIDILNQRLMRGYYAPQKTALTWFDLSQMAVVQKKITTITLHKHLLGKATTVPEHKHM